MSLSSQELLERVTELEESFQQARLDYERETRFNRDIQIHEMELMDQIKRIKTIMVCLDETTRQPLLMGCWM